jgi:hypothetical protein
MVLLCLVDQLLNRLTYRSLTAALMLLFTFIGHKSMNATHIVGGEITYEYLGNDLYLVTLTIYRDCGPANTQGTGFDASVQIGVFLSNGTSYDDNFFMSLSDADVEYIPVELDNPCFILPPDLCVERAVYTGTIDLPFNAGGYTLVHQRCCRNPSIVNLDYPEDQGATFTTQIPGTSEISVQNNSAVFTNFLLLRCVQTLILFSTTVQQMLMEIHWYMNSVHLCLAEQISTLLLHQPLRLLQD